VGVQGVAGTAQFLCGASAELDDAFSKIERSFLVSHGGHTTAGGEAAAGSPRDPRMNLKLELLDDEEESPADHTRYAAAKARLRHQAR
jgi:hypothetical protein